MLRVTTTDERSTTVKLKVEGRIASEWTDVLERECRARLQQRRSVLLDFSGVTFVDRSGVELLKSLSGEDIEIINCSAFIEGLLTEEQAQ